MIRRSVRVRSTGTALRHHHVEPQQTEVTSRRLPRNAHRVPACEKGGNGRDRPRRISAGHGKANTPIRRCGHPDHHTVFWISTAGDLRVRLAQASCVHPGFGHTDSRDRCGQTMEWPMTKCLCPQSVPRPHEERASGDRAAERSSAVALKTLRALARQLDLERLWIFLLLWRLKPHQQPPCRV